MALKNTKNAKPKKAPVAVTSAVKRPLSKESPSAAKPAEAAASKAASAKALTAAEKADLKKMLLSLRSRVAGQIDSLKVDSLKREDSINNLEDGTDAFERQMALALVSSEHDALFEITESIRRIDEGSYGTCEECTGQIERPRLKALPFVRTCIACQSKREKTQGRQRVAMMRAP